MTVRSTYNKPANKPAGYRPGRRRYGRWHALCASLLLAACAQQPDYVRPVQDLPTRYTHSEPQPLAELPQPSSRWWTAFGSPELDALVDEALANNRDLRAAVQRIGQLQALAAIDGAAQAPRIGASVGRTAQGAESGDGNRTTTGVRSSYRSAEVGLTASYEFDLWGINRATAEAALANLQASVYDREAIAMTLTAEVVRSYLLALRGGDRMQVAEKNLHNMRRVLDTVEKRDAVGEGTQLDIAQQRTFLHQLEATIPVLAQEREQAVNRLAALIGRPPGRLLIIGHSLAPLAIPEVSAGLPSDLLQRRPDIRKAEATLVAANANIGAAQGKLLPKFSLTAEAGLSAAGLGSLGGVTGGLFTTIIGNISAQLFDNGRATNELAYREARFRELAETYGQTVLTALREVEDGLVAVRRSRERAEAQSRAAAQARRSFALMTAALEIGSANSLQMLEAERTLNTSEDDAVLARHQQLDAFVSLARALGGGMETPPEDQAVQQPAAAPQSPSQPETEDAQ